MKHAIVLALILLGSTSSAQTIQFKGHAIGETAQQFYATATIAESHQLTVGYCTTLLNNPKAMKRHLGLAMPAEIKGCQEVMASLQNMDAEVGNRYASALGPGTTRFHAGKLIYMQFVMTTLSTPYTDVVADMTKKLNTVPQEGHVTYQNGFGATFQGRKATWISDGLIASVEETYPYRGEALQLIVTVMDAKGMNATFQQREATRPNTLDAVPAQPREPPATIPAQEEMREALKANSEAAKTSPAAAASFANAGHVLSPQELEELVQKGQASKCAVVTVPPGVDIEVDGNKLGVSPVVFVLLKRGETPRTITLREDGYKTVEKKVVPDGKTIPIGLTMEKQ